MAAPIVQLRFDLFPAIINHRHGTKAGTNEIRRIEAKMNGVPLSNRDVAHLKCCAAGYQEVAR